eukprot:1189825-Prorocentrum_minimum.AAC.3
MSYAPEHNLAVHTSSGELPLAHGLYAALNWVAFFGPSVVEDPRAFTGRKVLVAESISNRTGIQSYPAAIIWVSERKSSAQNGMLAKRMVITGCWKLEAVPPNPLAKCTLESWLANANVDPDGDQVTPRAQPPATSI